MSKPNILLIHSDQHRYDCIAAHGIRDNIRTPNLDQLCASGVSFSRAYCTIPICTPARASIMTGAWPTRHGSFCIPTSEINREARRELPTLFNLLKFAGYQTGWVGKYHGEMETDPGPENGVDEFVPIWHYHKLCEREGIPTGSREHGLFGDENTETPPGKGPLAWQADNVIRLMEEKSGEPFFIRWDPPEPHLPCNPTSPFVSQYNAGDIPPWQSWRESLEEKPGILRRQRNIWGLNGWTWEDWQPVVRLYYGIITEMDHHVGRVMEALRKTGQADNTLVLYSTDHGDFCGGHGLIDKHFCMYDDITRVPLILNWPGKIEPGKTCAAFASGSIDIATTIVESAGLSKPDTFDGENLVEMACNSTHRPRDVAYVQYFGTESGAYSCRMIRDERFKFVYHPVGDTHEFYNLEKDPGELTNLINDPASAADIARLKARLWDVMKENGDRLASAWTATELKDAPDYATKYGMNRNNRSK